MSVWGQEETQYFYSLTPDALLNAVETSLGIRCTGRVLTLNSMENRVYEIEMEDENTGKRTFLIAKFYRPGRWNKEQILEEHEFLLDLNRAEIPSLSPLIFKDGATLHQLPDAKIYYAVFHKFGGRAPDELNDQEYEQVGRLLARVHAVGATKKAQHRMTLNADTYGLANLKFLLAHKYISKDIEQSYAETVGEICALSAPLFARAQSQRIHGDCHFGNLLKREQQFFWVDFDDMVVGPPVQELWLLIPGRDDYAQDKLRSMVQGYEQMGRFDHESLALIEPLRALRFVHFSAWIARRWEDPAFQRVFSHFVEPRYWHEQLRDLQEQLMLIKQGFKFWV